MNGLFVVLHLLAYLGLAVVGIWEHIYLFISVGAIGAIFALVALVND